VIKKRGFFAPPSIPLYHQDSAFEGMRKAGRLAAKVLNFIEPFVKEGVTTEHLNLLCHNFILDHGAVPAPLGYRGYPKSVCISLNEVVCHGIPDSTVLKKGDMLNIDVTVILEGWYGDTSRMFTIGPVSAEAKHLIEVTYRALDQAIALVRPGTRLGDIGALIQSIVEPEGYSVVRDFCGHGIGRVFHGPPEVAHFGRAGTGVVLQEGMFFTIEPMVNQKGFPVKILADGWTVITCDGGLSAQAEHTLGVTKEGCEVFTVSA
jgi:methionyl aminopeptidase